VPVLFQIRAYQRPYKELRKEVALRRLVVNE
jgi:hypothetical protein